MSHLPIPSSEVKEGEDSFNKTESSDMLMSLQELTMDTDQNDHAKLSENPQFIKMLAKHGDNFPAQEEFLYSRAIIKVKLFYYLLFMVHAKNKK